MKVSCRHATWLILIVVFTFIAFAAGTVDDYYYYIPWTTVVVFFFFGFLFDVLFMSDAQFLFDPNYENWKRRIDPRY